MGVTSAIGTDGTKSKLVVVPPNICHAAQTQCPHYTHDSCLALLQSEVQNSCPRCKEFQNLAHIDSSVGYKIPNRIYSDTIYASTTVRGFKATSKIEQVVQWFGNVPQEDKVIIYSFFEGSLDLLEGIFVENLNIDCARFDDDVDAPTQAIELSRFKNSPTCRILLATVQSSGTGLNIDEANHVAFLDRCFNTAIHRQAEDRSHNLRQKKEVEITYFDGSMTIDEVSLHTYSSKICEHINSTVPHVVFYK
jgi:SNF2 family DNA or RNA helicase